MILTRKTGNGISDIYIYIDRSEEKYFINTAVLYTTLSTIHNTLYKFKCSNLPIFSSPRNLAQLKMTAVNIYRQVNDRNQ